jgi:hypothetical protein
MLPSDDTPLAAAGDSSDAIKAPEPVQMREWPLSHRLLRPPRENEAEYQRLYKHYETLPRLHAFLLQKVRAIVFIVPRGATIQVTGPKGKSLDPKLKSQLEKRIPVGDEDAITVAATDPAELPTGLYTVHVTPAQGSQNGLGASRRQIDCTRFASRRPKEPRRAWMSRNRAKDRASQEWLHAQN